METPLDEVRQELASIADELLSLPFDAFAARSELRGRQIELRQRARKLIAGQPLHDATSLKAEFERLTLVRDKLLDLHLAYSSTSVGDAGIEADFTASVNKQIAAGAGLDEVEARLEEIIEQLRSAR
jgi:hypothetical protein